MSRQPSPSQGPSGQMSRRPTDPFAPGGFQAPIADMTAGPSRKLLSSPSMGASRGKRNRSSGEDDEDDQEPELLPSSKLLKTQHENAASPSDAIPKVEPQTPAPAPADNWYARNKNYKDARVTIDGQVWKSNARRIAETQLEGYIGKWRNRSFSNISPSKQKERCYLAYIIQGLTKMALYDWFLPIPVEERPEILPSDPKDASSVLLKTIRVCLLEKIDDAAFKARQEIEAEQKAVEYMEALLATIPTPIPRLDVIGRTGAAESQSATVIDNRLEHGASGQQDQQAPVTSSTSGPSQGLSQSKAPSLAPRCSVPSQAPSIIPGASSIPTVSISCSASAAPSSSSIGAEARIATPPTSIPSHTTASSPATPAPLPPSSSQPSSTPSAPTPPTFVLSPTSPRPANVSAADRPATSAPTARPSSTTQAPRHQASQGTTPTMHTVIDLTEEQSATVAVSTVPATNTSNWKTATELRIELDVAQKEAHCSRLQLQLHRQEKKEASSRAQP